MRRTRIVGCGVVLACALGAIGASSAFATQPELGRCVKVAGTGGFNRANCIAVSKTHTGEYEWLPGPGAKPGVKTRLLGLLLETTGKKQIKCEYLFLEEGAWASDKELKVKKVTMQGCILVGTGLRCFSNPAESGTIESSTPLNGELGFIPGGREASPWVGLDLKPESEGTKTLVEFFCGEPNAVPQYQVAIEGSVIGRVKPVNKMVENNQFALIYKQSAGVQIPTAFKGGVEDVLKQITTPTSNPLGQKTEQVGLASNAEMALEESLEIKNKP